MVGVHGLGLGLVWCLYRPMVRVLAVSLGLGSELGLWLGLGLGLGLGLWLGFAG